MIACSLACEAAHADPRAPHAIYLELLGKGGTWGAGYDYQWTPRLRLGAVGSVSMLDGQRLLSITPYLAVTIVGNRHHAWYVDAGPHIAHLSTPSLVPEWMGASSTGIGLDVSTGYEYRNQIVLRLFGMAAVGTSGAQPWFGASVGWTL